MIGQRFVRPHGGINRHPEALGDLRGERGGQRLTPRRQPVARGDLFRQTFCRLRERHKGPAQLLRQRAQVVLDLGLKVAGHRPVEGGGREFFGFRHAHIERHAVVGLAGLVGVIEWQRPVVERQRLGIRRGVVLDRGGIAQVVGLHHQKPRFGAAALAHEIDQIADGGNVFQLRGVETIRRLV